MNQYIYQSDIKVIRSKGYGKAGKGFYYIRPEDKCMNKSRKVSGFTHSELNEKIEKCIRKWFYPRVILYVVDGWVIGSNSKENALTEYWRVCDPSKINQHFEVKQKP